MCIVVKYRIDALPASRMPSLCACRKVSLQQNPYHGVHCSSFKRTRIIARHDGVKDVFVRWIRRAANYCIAEPRHFNADEAKKTRPDFHCTLGTSTYAGDVVIINPLAPSRKSQADPLGAAAAEKIDKHSKIVKGPLHARADHFVPLIFETFGAFSQHAVKFVNTVAANSGGQDFDVLNGLINDIAIAVQRGNARAVLASIAEGHYPLFSSDQQPDQDPAADQPAEDSQSESQHSLVL
jgi:hypothetical protein